MWCKLAHLNLRQSVRRGTALAPATLNWYQHLLVTHSVSQALPATCILVHFFF